ncbi:hypothetical protein [Burkholderia metallica]|uniref:hypothetical protein n=1 Tax=Burkholderia metallica TaxID=488729 RepID=UPI001CF52954|nr:hypothetical protein [Burkholderia metallica]MCA8003492.1 hypothetical protein [Burkholderia metallica]
MKTQEDVFKPRNWTTGIKHLVTIMRHPQQYNRYHANKQAFIGYDHLQLRPKYHCELADGHPYPDVPEDTPNNLQHRGVIFPGEVHVHTAVEGRLVGLTPFDHQQTLGVAPDKLGDDRHTLVVMRTETPNTPPVIRAAKKRYVHDDDSFPGIGRTQHTTLTGGAPVAAAALLEGKTLVMSSGHYRPDTDAAVKLAIAGKQLGILSRRETSIVDANDRPIKLDLKHRMRAVSNWSKDRA